MAKQKRSSGGISTPIASVRHKDTRKNIPTEELRDFVAEDEQAPKKILYPRNPDLDPQLVWKGKDEQDAKPLEVPLVPIYIQEKIHPQAIIEDFRRSAKKQANKEDNYSGGLFADFNGLPAEFDQRVDFYHHEGHWSNRLILGDSLLVMSSLAEKEGLKGKVQMIYLDPPYGIKFGSNWQVSTRKRDVKDGSADDLVRQPEQIKAFRDTWELGIHSYLAYLRDRLVTARELLTESGSIFVQIGDENVHLVRCILDEVFGAENFVADVAYAKTTGFSGLYLSGVCDYLLWYAKSRGTLKYRSLFREKSAGDEGAAKYREASSIASLSHLPVEPSLVATTDQVTSQGAAATPEKWFSIGGREWRPPAGLHWKTTVPGMERLARCSRLAVEGDSLRFVRLMSDFPVFPTTNVWLDIGGVQSRTDPKVYVVQTAVEAIKRCVLMTTDPGDLVLDPTCGSGTTAYVAEQWGRRWITIDTSRVALTLARTRIMAARYPYYILADSPEGIAKEAELAGKFPPSPLPKTECDPRKGFVYKRVPHVTLKAIANNEEIDAIHAKWQEQLEPLRARLNALLKQNWEEWEVPREAGERQEQASRMPAPQREEMPASRMPAPQHSKWPAEAKTLLAQWWQLRRERQREIDASIARKAEMEALYDQPYEDNKRVRVSGPFTVESLSPHRTLSVAEKVKKATVPDENKRVVTVHGTNDFGRMILENLRAAGVQNTRKAERLKFDSIEPFAGQWIHGEGKFTDADGRQKRAAICIGPEHGTVGPDLIKEAAKEAVRGVGFDLLIVCGFAFDPHVSEESKRYGKLVVLPTKINPDLAMGDLLKKTGAANLFMIFGEPDITVTSGQWLVAGNGRMIAHYEHVKELPGFGSLAEINRAGRDGISRLSAVFTGGKIRTGRPDQAGGSVSIGQYRGGGGTQHDGGISSIPRGSQRLPGGDGDFSDLGREAGLGRQATDRSAKGSGGGSWSDAQRAEALAALQSLSQSDFPLSLTTDHKSQVTIHGLDVYDPTTGEVRASSTDDIACWFIDTDYNGESFFVRHAYFTGAGEPYDRLKRALRAEIDEAAWAALYTTRSRPFAKPSTGKIAVKVINHYGDEVLKVCPV